MEIRNVLNVANLSVFTLDNGAFLLQYDKIVGQIRVNALCDVGIFEPKRNRVARFLYAN